MNSMNHLENSHFENEVRRCQQTLFYSGRAYILIGIWSAIKIFLWLYLDPIHWKEEIKTVASDQFDMELVMKIMIYGIFAVIFMVTICVHLYIGLSAMKESQGKRKRFTYVVVAMINMGLMISSYRSLLDGTEKFSDTLGLSLTLDLTNMIILIEIVINAWKLRKHRE